MGCPARQGDDEKLLDLDKRNRVVPNIATVRDKNVHRAL